MKTFCQLEQLPAPLQVMQISHFLHSDLQGQKNAYSVQGYSWSLVPDVIVDRRAKGISLCPLDAFP